MLLFLDYFFLVFHAVFTVFSLTGWAFRPLRVVHLAAVMLTAFSWGILGIFRGWGYCPLTDWHWQVRDAIGEPVDSYSYIHFFILEITGVNLDPGFVDTVTVILFAAVLILSVILNIKDYRRTGDPNRNKI